MLAAGIAVGAVTKAQKADAALPTGFSDKVALSGLTKPTHLEFAADGTIFVTEKSGKIWSYQGFADPTPKLVADLSSEVDDYWDRGLLGLAAPPNYPADNHLYVLYARDAPLGGTAPTWNDACPTPPGPTTDGCTISGRLSRLTIVNGVSVGEQPLIDDWCQQFPSHSVGTLLFGADGYLYASGGEGASFTAVDYGQFGAAKGGQANICGDPPGGVGTALTPPDAQGGSLRAQSALRPSGPAVLNGTVIRIDPATGAAAASNPFAGSTDANKARIVAFGLRNPFRMTTRPGTGEIWVGDVGQGTWEEIDRIASPTAATPNFGWPCYEGAAINTGFQSVGLTQCSTLYNAPGSTVAPHYTYNHANKVTSTESCPTGGSSITGLAFYNGTSYPSQYRGALFFTDHTRECLWAMLPDASGTPDKSRIVSLDAVNNPVDLVAGPAAYGNDIFYVAMENGSIHRLSYSSAGALPPTAVAGVTPTSGKAPLTVTYNGAASSDPEKSALTYAWEFGDGGTSSAVSGTHTYTTAGSYTAKLTVKDAQGLTDSTSVTILAGSQISSLKVTISSPSGATIRTKYRVGDRLDFSGTAVDAAGKVIPASNYTWHLNVHHCATPTNCHLHDAGVVSGVSKGRFTAPDHPYPYYLTIDLTVGIPGSTDTITKAATVQPQTVALSFITNRSVTLPLTVDGVTKGAPATFTMVMGHLATISAPKTILLGGHKYVFVRWSDGGAATHTIVAPASANTRLATYNKAY